MDSSVKSAGDKRYQVIIIVVLSVFAALAILPFILLVSSSFTEESTLLTQGYSFIPRKFSAYAYEYLFSSNGVKIFRAYGVTFIVTIIGTGISLLIGPMLAWTLSRKDYKRAKVLSFMVFFTMLFNGGIVPSYLMWTSIFHVKNTLFGLIFPSLLFNGFYILLYKNNFSANIHPALVEAAKIDGAGEVYIYFHIVLPLSLPILATIGLMVGLGYWNDWTNVIYYITEERRYSLQVYLNSILNNIAAAQSMGGATIGGNFPGISIRMAMAVIGIVPIMVLYPFFQKYFVKGIAIGGVKE